MTVHELILLLQECDDQATILVEDNIGNQERNIRIDTTYNDYVIIQSIFPE